MLFRFSLYGFLKNQQYFEPFLILFFLKTGLSFFTIGLLVGFRDVMVNLLEVPSGALADAFGRRKTMILSFSAYITAFLIFGWARHPALFFVAMTFFAMGEACRTGTHKAMIFHWLEINQRLPEKAKVYGYTRSWSKLGSALSAIIAGILVITTKSYEWIFFFSCAPYMLGIINFLGYPEEIDRPECQERPSIRVAWQHLKTAFGDSFRNPKGRRLVLESMGFEGMFRVAKDYLQPLLAAFALSLFSLPSAEQTTALIVTPVYVLIFLLSAWASRQGHRLAGAWGGERHAAHLIWIVVFFVYAILLGALWYGINILAITGFVLLFMLQNTWRPLLISRFASSAHKSCQATSLSIENQAKSLAAMLLAPLVGYSVDLLTGHNQLDYPVLWPVGAWGLVICLPFVLLRAKKTDNECTETQP